MRPCKKASLEATQNCSKHLKTGLGVTSAHFPSLLGWWSFSHLQVLTMCRGLVGNSLHVSAKNP